MTTHTMRLRDPWQVEMEGEKAIHRRRFGKPTRLEGAERVWIVRTGGVGTASVWLNDEPINEGDRLGDSFEIEVTNRLRERNELRLEITPAETAQRGEIALEIRAK